MKRLAAIRLKLKNPLFAFVLFLVLASGIIRLINLDSPILFHYAFRQTQTAITTWTFVEDGISLFNYQTPVFGPPWQIPFEFPIYQAVSAIVVKLGIAGIDMAGKIVSMLFFYLSAWFLYELVKTITKNTTIAAIGLVFYVWSPFNIIWSRAFMIDYTSVAFALGYFYFAIKWLEDTKKVRHLILAVTSGTLGYLVKGTTMPVVVVPLAYYILKYLWLQKRTVSQTLIHFLRTNQKSVVFICLLFLIPFVAGYGWTKYADHVKSQSGFTKFLTSASLTEWLFGTWAQRADVRNWAKIAKWQAQLIVTYPLLILSILLFIVRFKKLDKKALELALVGSAAVLLTIAVFFNLFVVHEYYLMSVTPILAVLVAVCLESLFTNLQGNKIRSAVTIILPLVLISTTFLSADFYTKRSFSISYNHPTCKIGRFIQKHTSKNEYLVFDNLNWSSHIPYYAKRRAFMFLPSYHNYEQVKRFLKQHNFTTIIYKGPKTALLSNWKYHKKIGTLNGHHIVKVSDRNPLVQTKKRQHEK